MLRHLEELLVLVGWPEVPPTNNAAERSLRPREISRGTRSKSGTDANMELAALFGTWHAQDLDLFDQCRQLLISPQL